MKVCGIVVEYDPFHNGHIYHIQQARQLTGCDILVAVMSGNFVQRGQPACIDKWARTRFALGHGVDLVLELPFASVVQGASHFARGAIDILAMAQADDIVFGSETGNLAELTEISQMSFNVDNFRANMKLGYSYPKSYGMLADSYGPNDILAIAYLKELARHPTMVPHAIQRTSGYFDTSMDVAYPSGTAIRAAVAGGQDVAACTPMAAQLAAYPTPSWRSLYPYVRTQLLTMGKDDLNRIFLMDEGIENHLYQMARQHDDFDGFLAAAVTRRYTRNRIQRTLCHLLVHNSKEDMAALPPLDRIRPLGFNDVGQAFLRHLKQDGVVVADHWTANIYNYRSLEFRAACAYAMLMDPVHRHQVVRGEISGLYLKDGPHDSF